MFDNHLALLGGMVGYVAMLPNLWTLVMAVYFGFGSIFCRDCIG